MLTAEELTHTHVVKDAFLKLNNLLHGHVSGVIFAKSVGESKSITTAWPLSEKRLESIEGAGTAEKDDNICTVVFLSFEYSAGLILLTVKTIEYIPLVDDEADR